MTEWTPRSRSRKISCQYYSRISGFGLWGASGPEMEFDGVCLMSSPPFGEFNRVWDVDSDWPDDANQQPANFGDCKRNQVRFFFADSAFALQRITLSIA